MKYGIGISGFQPELIIKPFLRMLEPIDELVLLVTENTKSIETSEEIKKVLGFAGVECRTVKISDIFNFFEVLVNLENLFEKRGKPSWINVSAGPGIAISALTFFGINHGIIVVFYNKENDKTVKVDVTKSKDLFRNANKNLSLLKLIEKNPLTLKELSFKLNLSKSTVSRRIRILKSAYMVETSVYNKNMSIKITDTSRKLLEGSSLQL